MNCRIEPNRYDAMGHRTRWRLVRAYRRDWTGRQLHSGTRGRIRGRLLRTVAFGSVAIDSRTAVRQIKRSDRSNGQDSLLLIPLISPGSTLLKQKNAEVFGDVE